MRVLITGATGFVGGAIARALVQQGADVHAIARRATDRSLLAGLPVTWHEGDITDPTGFNGAFEGATWIIHAAGRLGQAGVSEELYHRINVVGTRNVLAAALRAGGDVRVLHVSTPGVLGKTTREPAREDLPYAPGNAYERSKAEAEREALECAARGLPVVVVRPGFIYGPGDHHVLKLFRAVARGRFFYIRGGKCLCHPTFIEDVVQGMLLCLRHGRVGEAYHITGPCPVTFRELGETIAGALGMQPPWLSLPRWSAAAAAKGFEALGRFLQRTPLLSRTGVDFFAADRVFSWRKAHGELGYTPQYSLAAGVARTFAWYRQHGWL